MARPSIHNRQPYSSALREATDTLAWEDIAEGLTSKKSASGRLGYCQFHSDSNPSCTYNNEGKFAKRFRCWSCGAHGDMADYVGRTRNLDKAGSLKYLQEIAGTIDREPTQVAATPERTAEIDASKLADANTIWDKCDKTIRIDSPLYRYLVGRVPSAARHSRYHSSECEGLPYTDGGMLGYISKETYQLNVSGRWFWNSGDIVGVAVCGWANPMGVLCGVEVAPLKADGRRVRDSKGCKLTRYVGSRSAGSACVAWSNDYQSARKMILTEGPWNAWAVRFLCDHWRISWDTVRLVVAAGSVTDIPKLLSSIDEWKSAYSSVSDVILIPDPDTSGLKDLRQFYGSCDLRHLPSGEDVVSYINTQQKG